MNGGEKYRYNDRQTETKRGRKKERHRDKKRERRDKRRQREKKMWILSPCRNLIAFIHFDHNGDIKIFQLQTLAVKSGS